MSENKHRNSAGFTLMEVMVALTIVGVTLAYLTSFFSQTIYVQQQLSGRIMGLVLGQGKLAELTYQSENSLSGEFPAPYQNYKWSAAEETVEGGKLIRLKIEWRDRNAILHQTTFTGYQY